MSNEIDALKMNAMDVLDRCKADVKTIHRSPVRILSRVAWRLCEALTATGTVTLLYDMAINDKTDAIPLYLLFGAAISLVAVCCCMAVGLLGPWQKRKLSTRLVKTQLVDVYGNFAKPGPLQFRAWGEIPEWWRSRSRSYAVLHDAFDHKDDHGKALEEREAEIAFALETMLSLPESEPNDEAIDRLDSMLCALLHGDGLEELLEADHVEKGEKARRETLDVISKLDESIKTKNAAMGTDAALKREEELKREATLAPLSCYDASQLSAATSGR